MAEITRFYDVLLSRSEAILDHVETFPLDAMPATTLRLSRLQLALAHAAMSVELHKQPRAPHSPYPHQVRTPRTAETTIGRAWCRVTVCPYVSISGVDGRAKKLTTHTASNTTPTST